jgi:hypothetical protein
MTTTLIAHKRLDKLEPKIEQIDKDVASLKTETKIQFKEIFVRIKRIEALLIGSAPPWYKSFSGSIESEAANAFAAKKRMDKMKAEVEQMISFMHGPQGLEEYKETIRAIKKRREQHEYRKQRMKESIIEWVVGIVAVISGAAILIGAIWLIGKNQGKW